MLELSSVRAGYGTFQALFDVSLQVRQGEAVAVIGPNGAGKTTLMRVVSGMIRPTAGAISMEGVDLVTTPAHRIIELGMAHVPESRRLFASMTVEENLLLGRISGRPGEWNVERVLEMFPNLKPRRHAKAGHLSGGEQQATAIGRALMTNPRLLLLDEPMEGLAPIIVEELARAVRALGEREGLACIVVEQHPVLALSMTDRAIVLERGTLVHSGDSAGLAEDTALLHRLLGVGIEEDLEVAAA